MDLSRVAMVIGNKWPVLRTGRIAVVGSGGVGSYVAESLCGSGVGHLLLIDADKKWRQVISTVSYRRLPVPSAGSQSGLISSSLCLTTSVLNLPKVLVRAGN